MSAKIKRSECERCGKVFHLKENDPGIHTCTPKKGFVDKKPLIDYADKKKAELKKIEEEAMQEFENIFDDFFDSGE